MDENIKRNLFCGGLFQLEVNMTMLPTAAALINRRIFLLHCRTKGKFAKNMLSKKNSHFIEHRHLRCLLCDIGDINQIDQIQKIDTEH